MALRLAPCAHKSYNYRMNPSHPPSDEVVAAFYDRDALREWQRFERHPLEFAITQRALAEYLPPPPAQLLDCGGGPGRYAIHLAKAGYDVTLLDLSAGCLALAKDKAAQAGAPIRAFVQGNALNLSRFARTSFDVVLLLGPLYHLTTAPERELAVAQALRVLRPGGLLLAAFVTLYAPLRDALVAGYLPEYVDNPAEVTALLQSQTTGPDEGFPHAWFAHPSEVAPLMEGAGLKTVMTLAAEGISVGQDDRVRALDERSFTFWANLNYSVCKDPCLFGMSDHLLYIGQKPL